MVTLETDQRLMVKIPEACRLTDLGRTTLYDLINRKQITVVKVGKAVRIPVASLRAWVDRQAAEAEALAAAR